MKVQCTEIDTDSYSSIVQISTQYTEIDTNTDSDRSMQQVLMLKTMPQILMQLRKETVAGVE